MSASLMRPFKDATADFYKAFGRIVDISRELNIQVATPEIVVIGPDGHGKSTFIQALLGYQATTINAPTKRNLFIHTIFNASCPEPRLTVKKDRTTGLLVDEVVRGFDMYNELARREVKSDNPLHVTVEHDTCWNVTIIDTPGLTGNADQDAATLNLCKSPNRLVVCIEKAMDWENTITGRFSRQFDPKGDRTLFITTHFSSFIKSCPGTKELNAWLSKSAAATALDKVHFVSLAGGNIDALFKADMELLEQMQYDLRYERAIGFENARKAVLDYTLRKWQEFVPAVLKTLRAHRGDSVALHARTTTQIGSMEPYKLRGVANQHVMTFLQSIEKLCTGTLEGIPTINGQTLTEERAASGVNWRDSDFTVLTVDDAKWNVVGAGSKLYGGHQFERLLSEFRALVLHTSMPAVSNADVAVASGPLRAGSNAPNLAWAASELARRACSRAFLPLIDQLLERAVYILERQVGIAERMLEQKRRDAKKSTATAASTAFGSTPSASSVAGAGGADSVVSNPADFPFFTATVKGFYFDAVHALAERCKTKCLDEFRCTQLIYWESGLEDGKLPSTKKKDDAKETTKSVTVVAQELFDSIKKRIADNIVLKCHNSFLVPMSEHLYGEIQQKVTRLTDADLDTMFEVKVTIARLKEDEVMLGAVTKRFEEMETEFTSAADQFSRIRK